MQADPSNYLNWIEISRSALAHNLEVVKEVVGDCCLIAPVVKGNAYGHGIVQAATALNEAGAHGFCVFSLDEALALRGAGIDKPILLLGYVLPSRLGEVVEHDLRLFLSDLDVAKQLSALAVERGREVRVHLKLDSGLTRYGVRPDQFLDFCKDVATLPNLIIEALGTHYATSDQEGENAFFHQQLEVFEKASVALAEWGIVPGIRHTANTAALLRYPEAHFEMVRPGRIIYGYYFSNDREQMAAETGVELRPAFTLKSRITMLKDVPAGTPVGYGCTHTTTGDVKVAILPIGYADGVSRFLGNRCDVLVGGKRVPIIGKVCMNITIVDVTSIEDPKIGDEVVLIGRQGDAEITCEEIAILCHNTLPYNILTAYQDSLPRLLVD